MARASQRERGSGEGAWARVTSAPCVCTTGRARTARGEHALSLAVSLLPPHATTPFTIHAKQKEQPEYQDISKSLLVINVVIYRRCGSSSLQSTGRRLQGEWVARVATGLARGQCSQPSCQLHRALPDARRHRTLPPQRRALLAGRSLSPLSCFPSPVVESTSSLRSQDVSIA